MLAAHVVRGPARLAAVRAEVAVFVLGFLGLAYSLYPYVVIDQLTIWQAASATESLMFILVGVAITVPAITGYTIFRTACSGGRRKP